MGSKGGEAAAVGVPSGTAKAETHHASFTLGGDETGFRKLFQVVGDGGGRDVMMGVESAAGDGLLHGNLLKHGEAARVGEGAGDGVELLVRESGLGAGLLRGHRRLEEGEEVGGFGTDAGVGEGLGEGDGSGCAIGFDEEEAGKGDAPGGVRGRVVGEA